MNVCKPIKHFQAFEISVLEILDECHLERIFNEGVIIMMNVLHLGELCNIWDVLLKGKRLVTGFNNFWRI